MYHHREQKESDWGRWKEISKALCTVQKYKLMRPLPANTGKCRGGIACVLSGLRTLGWGTKLWHAAAISRSACLEHGACFWTPLQTNTNCPALCFPWTGSLAAFRWRWRSVLLRWDTAQYRCSCKSSSQSVATSNQVSRTNSALSAKQCVIPSWISSGSCWDHFTSPPAQQAHELVHPAHSSQMSFKQDRPSFYWCCWVLMVNKQGYVSLCLPLLLAGLISLDSSTVADCFL